jgi:hypothetical protein
MDTGLAAVGCLRCWVLNREIALNGAVLLAVPAAVVGWMDRVQEVSIAVRHFSWPGQVYRNRPTVVERRVRIQRIVGVTARL